MYLGCIFLVFPAAGASSASVRWRVGAIGVLVYCVALRLAYVDLVNLMPQEAYYWNYSEHLDLGYLDHPPMTAWLIWAASKIFGRTELAVRISALACWGAAAVFSFLLRNIGASTSKASAPDSAAASGRLRSVKFRWAILLPIIWVPVPPTMSGTT